MDWGVGGWSPRRRAPPGQSVAQRLRLRGGGARRRRRRLRRRRRRRRRRLGSLGLGERSAQVQRLAPRGGRRAREVRGGGGFAPGTRGAIRARARARCRRRIAGKETRAKRAPFPRLFASRRRRRRFFGFGSTRRSGARACALFRETRTRPASPASASPRKIFRKISASPKARLGWSRRPTARVSRKARLFAHTRRRRRENSRRRRVPRVVPHARPPIRARLLLRDTTTLPRPARNRRRSRGRRRVRSRTRRRPPPRWVGARIRTRFRRTPVFVATRTPSFRRR